MLSRLKREQWDAIRLNLFMTLLYMPPYTNRVSVLSTIRSLTETIEHYTGFSLKVKSKCKCTILK